jgi:hypothetical protein
MREGLDHFEKYGCVVLRYCLWKQVAIIMTIAACVGI